MIRRSRRRDFANSTLHCLDVMFTQENRAASVAHPVAEFAAKGLPQRHQVAERFLNLISSQTDRGGLRLVVFVWRRRNTS